MNDITQNKILVIGGPNAGKTHFGGQLYGRLSSKKFSYKIAPNNIPADLTIFEDVLNKLYEGKRAGHTEHSANKSIELKVTDEQNSNILFSFPDYAGEQVKEIVANRQVNSVWKKNIEESTSWMLFVRLDEVANIDDITNAGFPNSETLKKRNETKPPVRVSDVAFFIELLQILLYVKKIPSFNKINEPKITIVLSCWDLLNQADKTLPSDVLNDKLPMLYQFVTNNWKENKFDILGLSSTQKELTDEPDEDYIENTPINFGYFINQKGEKEKDLTLLIGTLIGK